MTNWYDNVVYLTRNSSMTPSEIDRMSWYEYEMFLSTLQEALESEAEKQKQEEKRQSRSTGSFTSMASQMKSWFSNKK